MLEVDYVDSSQILQLLPLEVIELLCGDWPDQIAQEERNDEGLDTFLPHLVVDQRLVEQLQRISSLRDLEQDSA